MTRIAKRLPLALVALALAAPGAARGDVDGDGNILPTGNTVVDGAIAVANEINRAIRDQQDLQRVFIDRRKLTESLQTQLTNIGTKAGELHKLRQDAVTEADRLRKGKQARMAAARGDKREEERIEAEVLQREEELAAAANQLANAELQLKEAGRLVGQMKDTLGSLGARGDAQQALADWEGGKYGADMKDRGNGLKYTFKKQQSMLADRLRTFGGSVGRATAIIGKSSAIAPDHESVGTLSAVVTQLAGKKTELYINNRRAVLKDPIPLGKDNKLELRAVIVDARRKQSRDLGKNPPQHVTLESQSDYGFSYSMGARKSAWRVTSESYEWQNPSTRSGAGLGNSPRVSSRGGAVPKDDTLVITLSGDTASERVRTYVNGHITWQGPSTEEDSEGVAIEILVQPAR